MLRSIRHPVATCWILKILLVHIAGGNIVARTWSNDYNIMQHIHTARRNRVAKRAQHVALNNVAVCCIEMLGSFGGGFKLYSFGLVRETVLSQGMLTCSIFNT